MNGEKIIMNDIIMKMTDAENNIIIEKSKNTGLFYLKCVALGFLDFSSKKSQNCISIINFIVVKLYQFLLTNSIGSYNPLAVIMVNKKIISGSYVTI